VITRIWPTSALPPRPREVIPLTIRATMNFRIPWREISVDFPRRPARRKRASMFPALVSRKPSRWFPSSTECLAERYKLLKHFFVIASSGPHVVNVDRLWQNAPETDRYGLRVAPSCRIPLNIEMDKWELKLCRSNSF